ncbi:hypothetical protein ABMA28_003473 [Loxostege sticticalis]|uniref:Uncharacterized protein n=1 Tax=Loxostege sticticalis TaxID=481309 RepID=A0ABD0SWF2_LOXSC
MRRARAKMDEAAVAVVRGKDRERYCKKKEKGEIYSNMGLEQRQIRKLWREKSQKRRDILKMRKRTALLIEENTPPSSPAPAPSTSSSFSRVNVGKAVADRKKRAMKRENITLKTKILQMNQKLKKYRMRIKRLEEKQRKEESNETNQREIEKRTQRRNVKKKQLLTRNKNKKQIRLLNDTLVNLYRPFWVVFRKVSSRNTCLCIIHENDVRDDLCVRALQKANILSYGTASDVAKSLCCQNTFNFKCLERVCKYCQDKQIVHNNYDKDDSITYERWITKYEKIILKSKEKICKKSIKETVKTTNKSLVQLLHSSLPVYMKHKNYLLPFEGLLHIDFSDNYNCKYSAEIQSAHCGGSKSQLSLHSCVYYNTDFQSPDRHLKTTSICTVSENLRHDPVFICVHLQPLLHRIKEISPEITELHILSDGPSTRVKTIIWHYSEKGHGKGAPDGVGGCVNTLCDNSVAMGKDVSSYNGLMKCLKENCKGLEIYGIDDSDVPKIQSILDKSTTKPSRVSMCVHGCIMAAVFNPSLTV